MRAGYPIEIDLHLSRDGALVVFHDDELDRLTTASGPIDRYTRDELADLSLRAHGRDTGLRIPFLEEVLELVGGRVPLVVEVKNRGSVGPLESRLAERLDAYSGEFTIQSFNPRVLAWFRKHRSQFSRGLLATNFSELGDLRRHEKFLLRRLLLAPAVAPDYVGYDLRCLPYWAPGLTRRLGIPLVAWTIRTAEDHDRALDLADNIIFEEIRPPLAEG